MGIGDLFRKELQASAFDVARDFFEPQLEAMGVNKFQIESQNMEGLNRILENINDALKNPASFGTAKLKTSAELGTLVVVKSGSDFQFEIGIVPFLLERKKLVLDRISILRRDEKIDTLRDAIKKISDDSVRIKLETELDNLESESKKLREQSREVEQAQAQEKSKTGSDLAKVQLDIFERRSRVYRSFLERESVATIIGALLLVMLVIAQLTAMFLQTPTSDIVNNAFLLILGYFFGQTTVKTSQKE